MSLTVNSENDVGQQGCPPASLCSSTVSLTSADQANLVCSRSASLYIHIPWCRARCGYCDFNTYVADTSDPAVTSPYVEAMLAEIRLAGSRLGHRRVTTVYFGGGTPTLMPLADYRRLMAAIRQAFDLDPAAEVTTEANPETVGPALLEGLRELGVNRLSLGMQSAVEAVLATLDRVHTPGRVREAVAWARSAGFDSLSLDLIYGTPGESMADWEESVGTALDLEPDHLSAYSLISGRPAPPRRRRPGRQVPAGRRSLQRRRPGLVRGLQLGPAGAGLPPQPGLLAWRRLVGDRGGGPFPSRPDGRGSRRPRQSLRG